MDRFFAEFGINMLFGNIGPVLKLNPTNASNNVITARMSVHSAQRAHNIWSSGAGTNTNWFGRYFATTRWDLMYAKGGLQRAQITEGASWLLAPPVNQAMNKTTKLGYGKFTE